jgi:hypothetical protein
MGETSGLGWLMGSSNERAIWAYSLYFLRLLFLTVLSQETVNLLPDIRLCGDQEKI